MDYITDALTEFQIIREKDFSVTHFAKTIDDTASVFLHLHKDELEIHICTKPNRSVSLIDTTVQLDAN